MFSESVLFLDKNKGLQSQPNLIATEKKNKVTLARIDGRDLNQSICTGKAEQDVLWLSRRV